MGYFPGTIAAEFVKSCRRGRCAVIGNRGRGEAMGSINTKGNLHRSSCYARVCRNILFVLSAGILLNVGLTAVHGQETTGLQTQKDSYDVRFSMAEKLMKKGVALGREKKYEESVQVLREAVELIPDNAPLWYNLGLSLYHSGKAAEALEAWNKTVSIRPNYQDVWYMIGLARSKDGKSAEAIAAFSKNVEISPDDSQARASLIRECLRIAANNMNYLKKTDPVMSEKLAREFPGGLATPGTGAAGPNEHPLGNTEIPGMGKKFNELLEMFKKIPFQRGSEK